MTTTAFSPAIGEHVWTPQGAAEVLEKVNQIVNGRRIGLKYRVETLDPPRRKLWLQSADVTPMLGTDYPEEGYRCGSCDALLGNTSRPCPRCDGYMLMDRCAFENELDLAMHDDLFPDGYRG